MKIKEFMGIYNIARKQFNLCMSTKKSIHDGCSLKIYQGSKMIIGIKDENEESMYEQAIRELKHFMQRENHAASSTTIKGDQDGKEIDNSKNRNV